MKITVMTADDRIVSIDVEAEEPAENVKALLEVETGVPLVNQRLLHNSRDVPNSASLRSFGISEGDLLIMQVTSASPSVVPAATSPGNSALNPDGSAVDPRSLQQQLRSHPSVLAGLRATNPEFAQAILGDDLEIFQHFLREQHRQKLELQHRQQEEIALLNADPFDLDAQRKIEDLIRQKNIDENWEAAIEHNPEAFARVIMLYVDMEVNGVPIKAFVDSGAQMTIISRRCAERCGLLRLLDKRYVGIAKGVGQSEIVGRIHVAHIKIGGKFFMCSFTVLDQSDVEFIFGLDMLRKHQCSIDLRNNVLTVGGGEISVPFLQEKDLPEHFREQRAVGEQLSFPKPQGASTSGSNANARNPFQKVAGTPSPADTPNLALVSSTPPDLEAKIARLMQLGFDRETCVQALQFFNGNEDQAASYLFGG